MDKDQEASDFVTLTNTCQALNCLPHPGGLYAQDCLHVLGMQIVLGSQAKVEQEKMTRAKEESERAARR